MMWSMAYCYFASMQCAVPIAYTVLAFPAATYYSLKPCCTYCTLQQFPSREPCEAVMSALSRFELQYSR